MFRPAMQIWEFFNHFKILGKSWGALLLPLESHFHWNEWNWQLFKADFSFLKKTITRFSLILENFKNTCPALVASYIVFWYLDKTGYGRSRIFVTQAFNKIVSALFWGCVLLKLEDFSFTWQGRQISGPSICKIWHGPYSGPLPRIWVQTRGVFGMSERYKKSSIRGDELWWGRKEEVMKVELLLGFTGAETWQSWLQCAE